MKPGEHEAQGRVELTMDRRIVFRFERIVLADGNAQVLGLEVDLTKQAREVAAALVECAERRDAMIGGAH